MSIGKVALINFGFTLIPVVETHLKELEDNDSRLTQVFKAYQAKKTKKWVKYFIWDVPKRIMTLEELIDVTTNIAEEAFGMSYSIKPEWAC